MTLPDTLPVSDFRQLIVDSMSSAHDADSSSVGFKRLVTPLRHRNALRADTTVVIGARGVGKTVWYNSLLDADLRALASDKYKIPELARFVVSPGFGNASSTSYPSARILRALIREFSSDDELEDVWLTVVLDGLRWPALAGLVSWSEKVRVVVDDPEGSERFLIEADEAARVTGRIHLFVFDGMDRLATDRTLADKLASAILRLALRLRLGYQNIRAKMFIRPDMYESLDTAFADASKLDANKVDLRWDTVDLFGLFFHHLGNSGDESVSREYRDWTGVWETRGERKEPPVGLSADSDAQRKLFAEIAGPFMGTNHRRGHTYTWLPNHLADGWGQVSPRSFLTALQQAADLTLTKHAGHAYPLYWDAIREGVQGASTTRVSEISEDIPWVRPAVAPLRGLQVPIDFADLASRWDESDVVAAVRRATEADEATDEEVRTGPTDLSIMAIYEDLADLGILTVRTNGRVDMPDVYRIAFDLGRRGGVPRIASS